MFVLCVFMCSICVDPLRYVPARILLNIQKRWCCNTDRLPCQERALAVSWWGRLAVTACVGVGYGSTINRPHDGKTSGQRPVGNFIQAQSFRENLIMHGLCFLGSAAWLLFWMSLWRMNVLWKCTGPSVVIEYTPTEATLCLLEISHAFITTPERKSLCTNRPALYNIFLIDPVQTLLIILLLSKMLSPAAWILTACPNRFLLQMTHLVNIGNDSTDFQFGLSCLAV